MRLRSILWKDCCSYFPKDGWFEKWQKDLLEAQMLVQKSGRVRLVQQHEHSARWVVAPW